MRWLIYNILFTFAYLAMVPHFLLRMWRRGGYRNRFNDRFGRYPVEIEQALRTMNHPVWIHAVSVGEVYVAGQVMRAMRQQNPAVRFVLSTTSSTGWREAEKQVMAQDQLIFCPLDFPGCVKRALDVIQPSLFIFTESEIWPNLIRACAARKIPLYLVNARISDKSAPGYRRLRFWFGPILRMFTAIFAQSEMDKQRLVDAGAHPGTIDVTGSFKFDVANRNREKEASIAAFLAQYGVDDETIVLVGGSTWPGEDGVLVSIFKNLYTRYPALRLVIVPRHFEKADAVQAEIEKAGLLCVRKSRVAGVTAATDATLKTNRAVILADTTGELMGFYGTADIVFVGKSLCEHGAQNMIEPCLCGAATLVGPYTENFRPVMADLLAAQALIQVDSAEALERDVERLVRDASARKKLGEAGVQAVERRKGVVANVAATLNQALGAAARL
jgi:3-deoxy-D-manno-octulosonic-acid transferase